MILVECCSAHQRAHLHSIIILAARLDRFIKLTVIASETRQSCPLQSQFMLLFISVIVMAWMRFGSIHVSTRTSRFPCRVAQLRFPSSLEV
jgi:hypothetical protein